MKLSPEQAHNILSFKHGLTNDHDCSHFPIGTSSDLYHNSLPSNSRSQVLSAPSSPAGHDLVERSDAPKSFRNCSFPARFKVFICLDLYLYDFLIYAFLPWERI